ncbi:MAG: hypothetical protein KY455_10440 [Euryarchaeota archaeon]|nr:hypothetical protein [Euryarchaeota archaeon]
MKPYVLPISLVALALVVGAFPIVGAEHDNVDGVIVATSADDEPHDDEEWQDTFVCLADPIRADGCKESHPFKVNTRYEAITATITLLAPGAVMVHGLGASIEAPDIGSVSTWLPGGAKVYPPGTTVVLDVDDPAMLDQMGTWAVSLSAIDTDATAFVYEGRVSFS